MKKLAVPELFKKLQLPKVTFGKFLLSRKIDCFASKIALATETALAESTSQDIFSPLFVNLFVFASASQCTILNCGQLLFSGTLLKT
jgi:hypothetical protein